MSKGFLELWADTALNGTALASSTTQTSLLAGITGEIPTLPAKYFERIGKSFKLRATGQMGNVVTTPGTLNLKVMLGAIAVFDSGAMPLNIVAKSALGWILDLELFCLSIGNGTSATLKTQGSFKSYSVIGAPAPTAGGAGEILLPYNAAPAAGSGFDSTAAQQVDLQALWSVSNAANTIRLETMTVGLWN